jgi:hypothetical protein
MGESSFLLYDSKKKMVSYTIMFFLLGLAMVIGALLAGRTQAMTASGTTATSSSARVQPYTGGAPMAKVFYPADGSTVTVTSTGAVIKQSPGHSAYREGWVSVCYFANINSATDLKGQLASGSSNPYSTNCQPQQPNSPTTNKSATPQTSSTSSTASATANANVNVAAPQTPAVLSSSTSAKPSATTNQNLQGSSAAAALPNTGPGNVLAIGGIATILGTLSHFILQRFRFRPL